MPKHAVWSGEHGSGKRIRQVTPEKKLSSMCVGGNGAAKNNNETVRYRRPSQGKLWAAPNRNVANEDKVVSGQQGANEANT